MTDKSSPKYNSYCSKRTADEAFGERLMTDVPECYNYGVFFDDGYDYMKHMKSMKEFVRDPNYVIENEEDTVIPDNYAPPAVEMVVSDDPVDDDFEIPSDDELITDGGELEDNFVELAGGKRMRLNDDDDTTSDSYEIRGEKPILSTANLPLHKIRLMERYLWGAEANEMPMEDLYEVSGRKSSVAAAAARKGRPLTEEEELLEKQFDKLMQVTKSRSGYDVRSTMSGTSVMSENLLSAVRADDLVISKRNPQTDDWECPDGPLKKATLGRLEEMSESDSDEDPLRDWVGKRKVTMDTINSSHQVADDRTVKEPEILAMPKGKPRSKPAKTKVVDISSSLESERGSDDEPEVADEVDFHRRLKGETAEAKRARKAALKAQKRERQRVKKANRANFRREEMLQSKASKSGATNGRRIFMDD
ncbi:expressed conserved protein [Echinococcus multilocularis]|uniref:Protein LTV1 homolog n=1 Tax=Echinococcus multilocularis TaxID=6211 RepID=A0A068Y8L3_ECHMU|nr:expressed conserved protein [Echinococcus multilocularis]